VRGLPLPSEANQHLQRVWMLPACQDKSARCRMSSAKMVDEMTGFIIVTAEIHKTETDAILKVNAQKVDTIVNVDFISHCHEEDDHTIIVLKDNSEITATQSLDEIIQRIRRSTAINVFAQ
jgi:hypothetical protein